MSEINTIKDNTVIDTIDLNKAVKENKEVVQDALFEQASKKKRGRPSKIDGTKPIIDVSSTSQSTMSMDFDLKPVLIPAIKIPFVIARVKTDFEGFLLSQEEALAIATSLEAYLKVVMPKLSEKNTMLAVFLMSLGTVGISKYMMYQEHQKSKQTEAK